jgi:hypothetical protein
LYSVTGHAQQYSPEIDERIFAHLLDQAERQHVGMFDFALVLAAEA